jgi:polysaccharide biosynthesis/export protein
MEHPPRAAVQLQRVRRDQIQLTGVPLMRLRTLLHLFLVLFAVSLAGCSSAGSNLPPLPAATSGGEAGYRLAPNDKLKITVFGAEDMSGDFAVNDAGNVSMPLVGDIKAAGLTPAEFARAIESRLREGYMKDPKVAVQANAYRPIYIFGEVTKPGEYPYASNMSVLNAVALGGGYSYRANQDYVIVSRGGREYKANVTARLQPDDIVRVPERFF